MTTTKTMHSVFYAQKCFSDICAEGLDNGQITEHKLLFDTRDLSMSQAFCQSCGYNATPPPTIEEIIKSWNDLQRHYHRLYHNHATCGCFEEGK